MEIFGAGPSSDNSKKETVDSQQFNESKRKELSYQDVDLPRKETLHAFLWGGLIITRCSSNRWDLQPNKTWKYSASRIIGLWKGEFYKNGGRIEGRLARQKPCDHACTLKINGTDLV